MFMNKRSFILLGFILLKVFLQFFLISAEYDLHRDEYLHLDQGNHLAWGYVSVPPLTSWLSWIIRYLGNGVFWIKFFPALFGVLTMVLVWKAIEKLKGNLFALILGSMCVLLSAILRVNTLYQPNSLDVLCWTALYYVLFRYIGTRDERWFYVGALVFAVGFLNKYNVVFQVIALFPAILLSEHRVIFTRQKFWLAFGLALLLILPNLLWQYNNHFPVIHHFRELSDTQLVHVDRIEFLKSQLLYFIGAIIVLPAAYIALLFYPPFRSYRLYLFAIAFTLILFMLIKGKDYYAIGIYPIYLAFGSVAIAQLLKTGWKRYLQPVMVLVPVLLFIPMYLYVFPDKSLDYMLLHHEQYSKMGLLRWEDGKDHELPQDFADMRGWKELGSKVDHIYNELPGKDSTLVLCDNYGQAGAINFYSKGRVHAVSFNADYVHWFDLTKKYLNLIRVKEISGRETELGETSPYFNRSMLMDSVTDHHAREFGTCIFVFLGAKVDINPRLAKEIRKAEMND